MADRTRDPGPCVVCDRAGGEATCVWCGWPRDPGAASGTRPGGSGEDPELASARRRVDLRAARLAAAGDPAEFARLAGLVRGGATAADQPDPAEQSAATATAYYPGRQVVDLLRALVAGDLHRLLFLQVGTEALVATTVHADPIGVPRVAGQPRTWRWRDLLDGDVDGAPTDASDAASTGAGARTGGGSGDVASTGDGGGVPDASVLRFHLAGGVGQDRAASPRRLVDRLLARLPRLRPPERGAIVLIPPNSRWRLLDQIAEELIRRYAVRGSGTGADPDEDPAAQLVEILRHTPSKYDIDLVLLQVKRDGTVWLAPRRLFAAGTAVNGSGPPTAEVDVYVSGARRPVALPVVIRRGDMKLPEQWTPLKVVQLARTETNHHRIRVSFGGPGRVDFLALDERSARPAGSPSATWYGLLNRVPGMITSTSVDLVVAVELAEPGAAERLGFARRLLTDIDVAPRTPDGLRVAVAGYYQHLGRRQRRDEQILTVDWRDFGDPASGRRVLDGLRPLDNRNDFAAAVEDLLLGADRLDWRDAARRVLMLVGSRPPYPSEPGNDITQTCDYHLPWQEPAARLRRERGIRLVSVWQRPPWRTTRDTDAPVLERLAQARQLLGADGCFDLEHTTPVEVARLCALDGSVELDALPLALAARGGDVS